MTKTAEYFRSLAYTRRVRLELDDDGRAFFVAFIQELPGVEALGASEYEARSSLAHAFDDYLAAMIEWGEEIPEPQQWPQSLGWAADEPGLEAGTVTPAALGAINVAASDPAVLPLFAGEVNAVQFGEELARAPETVAA